MLHDHWPALGADEPATAPASTIVKPEGSAEDRGRALTLVDPSSEGPTAASAGFIGLPPEADLSPEAIRRLDTELPDYLIQIALKTLGYYQGALDGKFGPASRRAAAAFQESLGAEATGDLRPAETVTLIAEAAKRGDPDSQNTYGGMFETGAGVIQDPVAAAKWYRLAADADNGFGQANLALLYAKGVGVERDPAEARRLLEKANENGVEVDQQKLKDLR
jgi:peptidoglycan hydrolase-like protein with peptidoglycan-binding domain